MSLQVHNCGYWHKDKIKKFLEEATEVKSVKVVQFVIRGEDLDAITDGVYLGLKPSAPYSDSVPWVYIEPNKEPNEVGQSHLGI
jgi:hypothetical protein